MLARTLLALGNPEGALANLRHEADEVNRLWMLPAVLQANGRHAEADEALNSLIAQWADRSACSIAMNYAHRGDRDLAFHWLERAYRQKDPDLPGIGEPMLKNLAEDPRYKALLRKMNLPELGY